RGPCTEDAAEVLRMHHLQSSIMSLSVCALFGAASCAVSGEGDLDLFSTDSAVSLARESPWPDAGTGDEIAANETSLPDDASSTKEGSSRRDDCDGGSVAGETGVCAAPACTPGSAPRVTMNACGKCNTGTLTQECTAAGAWSEGTCAGDHDNGCGGCAA